MVDWKYRIPNISQIRKTARSEREHLLYSLLRGSVIVMSAFLPAIGLLDFGRLEQGMRTLPSPGGRREVAATMDDYPLTKEAVSCEFLPQVLISLPRRLAPSIAFCTPSTYLAFSSPLDPSRSLYVVH